MPIEIDLPDGGVAEFPDGTAPETIKSALAKLFPSEREKLEADVRSGQNRPDYASPGMAERIGGLFGEQGRQLGAAAGRFSDQVTDPLNLQDELVGIGQGVRAFLANGGQVNPETWDKISKAYSDAGERVKAERRVSREDTGWWGTGAEVVGSLGTAGVGKLVGAVPTAWNTAVQATKTGAGAGAVAGFGSGEGGIVERAASTGQGAAIGAVFGPLISNVAVPLAGRAWGLGKDVVRSAQQALWAARNPEDAAIQSVADAMVNAKTMPADVLARISPAMSANLRTRGITDDQMAEIISRRLNGEAGAAIGRDFGIAGSTVDNYANAYAAQNPTRMNMLDVAQEMRGEGGAKPLLRRARGASGLADDTDTEKLLYDRQTGQAGRTSGIIQQSGGPGRRLEDEVTRLRGVARNEERDAYTTVYQHDNPVLIDDVIRAARARAAGRSGEIGTELNSAIDAFFEPVLREAGQAPATWLRITEARERVRDAITSGKSPEVISRLRRRAIIAERQDEFSRPLKPTKVGQPIQNVRRFVDARQELDQRIQRSMQDHRPTPLTGELVRLRTELNDAARANNPALASADARFYGNRTAERIIEQGEHIGKSLTPQSREIMRDFTEMTPSQQELLRVTMERQWADAALNVRNNAGAANQFNTDAFRDLVAKFYPAPPAGATGPARASQQAIYERGQALIKNLRREAITTNTTNFVTGRANSPTAPWLQDMEARKGAGRMAANAATGQVLKVLSDVADRLALQIGQKSAQAELRIMLEMEPAKLLRLLPRLDRAAQGTAQRQQLVTSIREPRAANRPGAAAIAGGYFGGD